MNNTNLAFISSICRWSLGFVFIYHGLFPKIIWLSPIEISLVEASGSGIPANIASPLAGVGEIVLGFLIAFWKGSKIPIYIASALLILLLFYVALVNTELLFEAFNPVTTNLPALILCHIILHLESRPRHQNQQYSASNTN